MIEHLGKIIQNDNIAKDVYKMVIESEECLFIRPGQFMNIKVKNNFLRRPISISCYDQNQFSIVYKVVGKGTQELSEMQVGEQLNFVGPLGNPFTIQKDIKPLIIGGGVGVPPLLEVCKQLVKNNIKPQVVLGFNSKEDVFYENEFKILGCEVRVATMDGSYGVKGTVMDAIKQADFKNDFVYACGPLKMLEAVDNNYSKGYLSFEARMACGIGACHGCVCKDKHNDLHYRVCKEGPVFEIGKVAIEC